MSRLSVYWPDECAAVSAAALDEPRLLQFPRSRRGPFVESRSVEDHPAAHHVAYKEAPRLDVIARARLLFSNRLCRHCHSPVVEPLQLDDAQVNRQGLEIPGSATIIGFRCHSCDAQWNS